MRTLALLLLSLALPAAADYHDHPRADLLRQNLKDNYGFSPEELAQVDSALAQAQRIPKLVEAEQKAPEKTENWSQYSRRIDDDRVRGGLQLIAAHRETFTRAEQEFGVPAPAIAAIMGVETRYGSLTGKTRVLDALATQGFDHPTRGDFFIGELAEFFAFCREFGFMPDAPQGSYAGAMGDAQFMPSNYRRLALDYDHDGRTDLWSIDDAIGSIAHYFVAYKPELGWTRGAPLVVPAALAGRLPDDFPRNGKAPTHTVAQIEAAGVRPWITLPPGQPAGLVELPLDDGGKEYWIALPNFYSVMTYNPRTFYAMAVSVLAQRIEQARDAEYAEAGSR
ncbi:MAG TPA: lytic murein transglycosylase [Nevskiaceae bacterium]|nr:lytic murein transglycosylase [Nevskiaceae bacterium]